MTVTMEDSGLLVLFVTTCEVFGVFNIVLLLVNVSEVDIDANLCTKVTWDDVGDNSKSRQSAICVPSPTTRMQRCHLTRARASISRS